MQLTFESWFNASFFFVFYKWEYISLFKVSIIASVSVDRFCFEVFHSPQNGINV